VNAVMSHVAERVVAECASCGQPLTGRYCAQCGEKVLDPAALTVRHFVTHSLLDELVHLDGKFWTTLRCLTFRPGFLSEEYSAGRRRLYVKPVRLLIATIITYALLTQGGLLVTLTIGWLNLSVAPTAVPESVSVAETVRRIDRFGLLTRMLASKQRTSDTTSDVARQRFHSRLNQFAQPLSFANVVLLALALYGIFHRRRPLLVDHAVFSMHLVSFVLVSSLALLPAVWLMDVSHGATLAIILIVTIWQFAYLTVAIRRFYFVGGRTRSRGVPILAAVLIYILNSAFITVVQMLGGAVALRGL
jgi:uncharacterized protein DUF3667